MTISNNIFIYNGEGTNVNCIEQTAQIIKDKYNKKYSVITIDASYMVRDHSIPSLYVLPGGQALYMAHGLSQAVEKIRDCVQKGSGMLGFCAGAMVASSDWNYRIPTDHKALCSTDGYPLLSLGLQAFGPVFAHDKCLHDDVKGCIVDIHLNMEQKKFKCFWNKGPTFSRFGNNSTISVAEYECVSSINSLIKKRMSDFPAVIKSNYGKGNIVFLGAHPELAKWSLDRGYDISQDDLKWNDYLFEESCRLAGLTTPESESKSEKN